MSELLAPFGVSPDAIEEPAGELEVAPPSAAPQATEPVVITEQEVLFATAAAVSLPEQTGRRWTEVVGAALRAMFTSSTGEQRPKRHYPPRNEFLESSRMAREMYRL